ncbi:MAG: 50S ribosome-binding GTPase [Pelatocladus maniniholoensis HA4357-MV3]|jgi:small GTP-binding protein|uniref:GTPase Era n=1 Tax=Pelatocladus maniniholoensis HA4357-MV3 TaxID=1117104 RepID=A0A9E3HC62_9NOST|nr:50S ribosome-binding GTPase [Pelatocladus maniniholoensis HA4357-MV3]BAZ66211.1 small GTP-binding protein [Fischerella sp. NIES-4106]
MNQKIEQLKEALPKIKQELEEHPPTIGLIGVSGVGKSSTINRLFKTNLATSDTVACTKEFEQKDIELTLTNSTIKNSPVQLRVIDAPGLGEDINLDPKYLQMYKENLGKCDVIIWVLTARNRAIALDQRYLQELEEFHSKIVFGLNQIDLVEPLNWKIEYNIPSEEQKNNIEVILQDRRDKLFGVIKKNIKLIDYSSKTGYKLEELFATIIDSCPEERTWIFNGLKSFSYKEYTPKVVLDALEKRNSEKVSNGKSWLDSFNPFN